jgi:phosphodiesterase/alkaline phosphatase D-like protein
MTKYFHPVFLTACLLVVVFSDGFAVRLAAQDGDRPVPCSSTTALPEGAPQAGELRFAAVGDTGRGNDGQRQIARALESLQERTKFNLLLFLGDNVYKKGEPDQFEKRLYAPYRKLKDERGVRIQGVLGNHDIDGRSLEGVKLQQAYFGMCGAAAVCDETFYQFAIGDTDFFGLDSNLLVGHKPDFRYTQKTRQDQIEWLKSELNLSRAKNRWQIVFMHHLFYSSSKGHGMFSGDAEDRRHKQSLQEIIPALNDARADLVLSGHDHLYEKIDAQKVESPNLKGDFAYFINGAGALTKNELKKSVFQMCGESRKTSFMFFSIKGDTLTYWAIDASGTPFDSGTIRRK